MRGCTIKLDLTPISALVLMEYMYWFSLILGSGDCSCCLGPDMRACLPWRPEYDNHYLCLRFMAFKILCGVAFAIPLWTYTQDGLLIQKARTASWGPEQD